MKKSRPSAYWSHSIFAIVLLSIFLYLSLWLINSTWYLQWLVAINLTTLSLFGLDKLTAPQRGNRVPEILFIGLTALGGWLGSWVGLVLFRHKINKSIFIAFLLGATVAHVALSWYWGLWSPDLFDFQNISSI